MCGRNRFQEGDGGQNCLYFGRGFHEIKFLPIITAVNGRDLSVDWRTTILVTSSSQMPLSYYLDQPTNILGALDFVSHSSFASQLFLMAGHYQAGRFDKATPLPEQGPESHFQVY
jgi:hypothetical protein